MVLKRKVTGIVLAGVLAVAAVVPMGLTASAASQGDVTVNYVTGGGLIPDDGDGTYYVTIPSSINFTAQDETKAMDVSLKPIPSATLSSTLRVEVKVYSKNNYKLTSTTANTTQGTYELKYHLTDAAQGTKLANNATGTTEKEKAKWLIANQKLSKTNPTFKGQAKLTVAPNDAVPAGTTYSDTLTYFVTETAK